MFKYSKEIENGAWGFNKAKNPDRLGQDFSALWWYLQESNQGHKDFQSFALPTELSGLGKKDAIRPYLGRVRQG